VREKIINTRWKTQKLVVREKDRQFVHFWYGMNKGLGGIQNSIGTQTFNLVLIFLFKGRFWF
jgi:hypothetical protein